MGFSQALGDRESQTQTAEAPADGSITLLKGGKIRASDSESIPIPLSEISITRSSLGAVRRHHPNLPIDRG